jgi:hypothetical protein
MHIYAYGLSHPTFVVCACGKVLFIVCEVLGSITHLCAIVAFLRGQLGTQVRLSVRFLVVSGGHVYGPFYLFFDVCAWFKELFFGC